MQQDNTISIVCYSGLAILSVSFLISIFTPKYRGASRWLRSVFFILAIICAIGSALGFTLIFYSSHLTQPMRLSIVLLGCIGVGLAISLLLNPEFRQLDRRLSAFQARLQESPELKTLDLRWAVRLKIVQSFAYVAAGSWVLLSAYLLHEKEAARSATYGCPATTTLRVDPIPGGDGQKPLYLVTVDTAVRNDTDRMVSINDYVLDFYVGKTLAEPSPGFFVTKPTLKHPTIDWKHFGSCAEIQQKNYETFIRHIHDNKELKKDTDPIGTFLLQNLKEDIGRIETFSFLRLPAGQLWTFEKQFVISASENDWIATDSVLIYDKGLERPAIKPETRVENIAVALRRASEIAPNSSPPGSNPAPR